MLKRESAYYVSLYQIRTWHEIYVQIQRTARRNAVTKRKNLIYKYITRKQKEKRNPGTNIKGKRKPQTEAQQAFAMLNAYSREKQSDPYPVQIDDRQVRISTPLQKQTPYKQW